MTWWREDTQEIALNNNKVLRELTETTLSDRHKSLINKLIKENDDMIAKAEEEREAEAQHYMRQAEDLYKQDVMKHFNNSNKKE
tara:strand:- start:32349 stop:32600 length:252 start_codon:yes stop_codon:yes gene_type:complete